MPALAQATRQGAAEPNALTARADGANLTLTLVLKRDDESGFQQYLHDVYDPASPTFEHFLTPAQIAEHFGPSQEIFDRLAAYLQTGNLEFIEGSSNRLTLTVGGKRGDVERAFGIHLGDYRIGEQTFFANDVEPSLPENLAAHVLSIAGLANLAQPRPLSASVPPPPPLLCPADVSPENCNLYGPLCGIYTASRATGEFLQKLEGNKGIKDIVESTNSYNENLQKYYANCLHNNFPSSAVGTGLTPSGAGVPWRSIDGTGQTIGLVEFDLYQPSDVVHYLNFVGAPASEINNLGDVTIGGGASFGAAENEVLIDIDTVMSLAPNAHVLVYNSSFPGAGTSFQRIFNRMVSDSLVTIISNSWAYCEDQTSLADVQGIDTILQAAAASGISVFSGSGDSGSTCLDGAANTIAVPADSPNVTAVGGTSLHAGAGGVYRSETWWDGSVQSPQSGQGGFGVSRFFAKPAYQSASTSATMRSVPDLSTVADPENGIQICQADAGGCPTGAFYGGTSMAAPIWAASAALLNQARGSNLGFVNTRFYPLGSSSGFHNAASMGSNFAHVGLGSPNLNAISLLLAAQTAGLPDANISEVLPLAPPQIVYGNSAGIPADGATAGVVVVKVRDANGNTVAGKNVALTANAGNHATILAPDGSTSSIADGTVVFSITDTFVETLTFTAVITTNALTLSQHPTLPFIGRPATSGSIVAFPTGQAADGASSSAITITLKDALNQPAPNKRVLLSNNGNSMILGENPGSTDITGQAQFNVIDQVNETAVYTAIDVSDDNVPVPGSASVAFSSGAATACGNGSPPKAASGYALSVYASGFPVKNGVSFGGINLGGCIGVSGISFDAAGNLLASDYVNGDVYKFPPGGGVASNASRIATLGTSLGSLTTSAGALYGVKVATSGDFATGAVLKINTTTGTAITVASGIPCPFNIATDPLSDDLFVTDGCFGNGADNASIWRVSNPGGGSPSTSVYATSTASPNGSLSFAQDGTLYAVYGYNFVFSQAIDQISATNGPVVPTVQMTGVPSTFSALAVGSNPAGGAKTMVTSVQNTGGFAHSVAVFDMTATPPVFSGTTLIEADVGSAKILGPDGCVYLSNANVVYKLSNADGSCALTGLSSNPSLLLDPQTSPAIAAQGSVQHFTATFPHTPAIPFDTPVTFHVSGANSLQGTRNVGFGAGVVFTYAGLNSGNDQVTAYAQIDGAIVSSNSVPVTWTPGKHTTFLNLSGSVTSGTLGSSVALSATLTDLSVNPVAAIAGAAVQFTLSGQSCNATTDVGGRVTCSITLSALTQCALTANYAGDSQFLATAQSELFSVSSFDVLFANGFELPLQGGGCILYN